MQSTDKPQLLNPEEYPTQIFVTNKWQVSTLLRQMLKYTGPARLTATSLSTSAAFLSVLSTQRKRGLLSHITLFLDHRATTKTRTIGTLLKKNIDDLRFAYLHAKIIVLQGRDRCISLITSQNQSQGIRQEAYYITTEPDIAAKLLEQLEAVPTCTPPAYLDPNSSPNSSSNSLPLPTSPPSTAATKWSSAKRLPTPTAPSTPPPDRQKLRLPNECADNS